MEDTFIVSAMSPTQIKLIEEMDLTKPVFVEGGFPIWLRDKWMTYFVLKAETTERYKQFQEVSKEKSEADGKVRHCLFPLLKFVFC